MSLTTYQRALLKRIVAAETGTVEFRRDIGRLQSANVLINGEEQPRSAQAFERLYSCGYVGIHRADRGIGAPPVQRVYTTGAGRDAA
jgi:hypothetical protein